MKISVRKIGRATILDLDGEIRFGKSENAVRQHVQDLVDAGTTQVAFNLANVNDLDSTGIGVLVRSFASLNRAGGKCTFYAANSRVRMLLKMVRLDTVLNLAEDEVAALSRL